MHISDEVNVFPHISDLVFEITGRLWQQMEEIWIWDRVEQLIEVCKECWAWTQVMQTPEINKTYSASII